MRVTKQIWNWCRSIFLSFIKRSFNTHASVGIADLDRSLNFYKKLGFRQVMATRENEVVLLRNHQGDELNLVAQRNQTSFVTLRVKHIEQELERLQSWYPNLEIMEGSLSRQVRLTDPDGNTIELLQWLDPKHRPKNTIYHIATRSELHAGLSDHYYLPPSQDNRFVRARARSAFMSLACNRVAEQTQAVPLIIEMDSSELSMEEQLVDEADLDSKRHSEQATYPRVNSPIARIALVAVGECAVKDGDIAWPTKFSALDEPSSAHHFS